MEEKTLITKLRVNKKPALSHWQKLYRWYLLHFKKQDYPVMMNIGWTRWPPQAVIVADVMNPTDAPGNIIRGPQFSLDWGDISTKHCSDCGISIQPNEWSFIGVVVEGCGPLKFVRFCQKCKAGREKTGTLFSWIT